MKASKLFGAISVFVAVAGFIASIALASTIKMIVITKGTFIDYQEEVFNYPLMIYVMLGTAFLTLCFYATSVHFKNQEKTLDEIKAISSHLQNEPKNEQ